MPATPTAPTPVLLSSVSVLGCPETASLWESSLLVAASVGSFFCSLQDAAVGLSLGPRAVVLNLWVATALGIK